MKSLEQSHINSIKQNPLDLIQNPSMKSQKSYLPTAGSGVQDHQHGGLKGRGRGKQRAKIRKKTGDFSWG